MEAEEAEPVPTEAGEAEPEPEPEREALIALYNATDGENWDNNTNWLSDEPLNNWGTVDTDGNGRVITLNLRGNRLNGAIPPELGQPRQHDSFWISQKTS